PRPRDEQPMLRKKENERQPRPLVAEPCYTRDGRSDWTIGPARHIDAHPGGHAKWVRNPHGPATVSGERFHTVRGRASDGQSLDFASGKTVNAQRSASQETWPRGRCFSSARETPQGGFMDPSLTRRLVETCRHARHKLFSSILLVLFGTP